MKKYYIILLLLIVTSASFGAYCTCSSNMYKAEEGTFEGSFETYQGLSISGYCWKKSSNSANYSANKTFYIQLDAYSTNEACGYAEAYVVFTDIFNFSTTIGNDTDFYNECTRNLRHDTGFWDFGVLTVYANVGQFDGTTGCYTNATAYVTW
ncbi:MAG: hypothetical protein KA807_10240 [Prolixibacteraceae bacterium]|nr:hypothetical protein [Prolixibacteraceae bacterium]